MNMNQCVSYAGRGKCRQRSSRMCAYNCGNSICTVNGDLTGKTKAKTCLERETAQGRGFSQKMNGVQDMYGEWGVV